MPVNRSVKSLTALVLAACASVAVAGGGTQTAGAQPATATTSSHGNPSAVPPILRPARPSELAAIRESEAQKAQAAAYAPPAGARYSMAEMNAWATDGSSAP
jgi:hypothetical protein